MKPHIYLYRGVWFVSWDRDRDWWYERALTFERACRQALVPSFP